MKAKLVCRVPQLLKDRGLTASVFASHFGVAGMSQSIGYKMARGETGYLDSSLLMAVKILGLKSISEIEDVEWIEDSEETGA